MSLNFNTLWGVSLKHLLYFNSHIGNNSGNNFVFRSKNRGWFGACTLGKFKNHLIINLNYTIFMLKKSINLLESILSLRGELLMIYGNRNYDYSNFMYYLSNKYSSNFNLKTTSYTFFYKRRYHYCVGWLGGILTNWKHLYWRSKLVSKFKYSLNLKNSYLWCGLSNMHFLPDIVWIINYYDYGIKEATLSFIPVVSVCNFSSSVDDLFYVIASNTDEYWNMCFYTILLREFIFFHYLNRWKNIKKFSILKSI